MPGKIRKVERPGLADFPPVTCTFHAALRKALRLTWTYNVGPKYTASPVKAPSPIVS